MPTLTRLLSHTFSTQLSAEQLLDRTYQQLKKTMPEQQFPEISIIIARTNDGVRQDIGTFDYDRALQLTILGKSWAIGCGRQNGCLAQEYARDLRAVPMEKGQTCEDAFRNSSGLFYNTLVVASERGPLHLYGMSTHHHEILPRVRELLPWEEMRDTGAFPSIANPFPDDRAHETRLANPAGKYKAQLPKQLAQAILETLAAE